MLERSNGNSGNQPTSESSSTLTVTVSAPTLPYLFTLTEACKYLDLHERTLRGFIDKGKVRAYRIGRSFRFREEDLIDALKPFKPAASASSELDDFIDQQIGKKAGARS